MKYKTYLFRTKDPVIDLLRTAIQLEADAAGIKFRKMLSEIAERSGVTRTALCNWFYGATISPRYCTVAAVANSVRAQIRLGQRKERERPKLRLVG